MAEVDCKMTFDTENEDEVKAFHELLNFLINYNKIVLTYYNDIHIYQEETLICVEWNEVPYDHSYGGIFQCVGEDEIVVREFYLPDNTIVDFQTKEEFDDYLEDWLKDNPGWVKTSYGTWTNEIENKKFKEELESRGDC